MNSEKKQSLVVLLLLDGWGVSKSRDNNAIRQAKIPNFKRLVSHYPAAIISGSQQKDSVNYSALGLGLSKIISDSKLNQLKIAETEKFALVSNFLNDTELPFLGEDWELVPAKTGNTNEQKMKMATGDVLRELNKKIKEKKYNFVLLSPANIDGLKKDGNMPRAISVVEYLDRVIGKISDMVLEHHGVLLVSSTHGYIEEIFDIATDTPKKGNNNNSVPFIIVGEKYAGKTIGFKEAPANDLSLLEPVGNLFDIAPTILKLLNLKQPPEMKGKSLI
jgi:2,3-bisphosphoglycerate-independent phosphoglycerate mutase